MQQKMPSFAELLAETTLIALHLEMCDHYVVDEEVDDFTRRQATGQRDADPASPNGAPWVAKIREATARGVAVRRVRIISEPASDYIRYEHAATDVNTPAGEEVRWLPRTSASDLALPESDYWVFDDRVVRFHYFTGDGRWTYDELRDEPQVVKLCRDAFDAAWDRAVPHEDYRLA
ncbi:DUF6879 family protein [Streptacidiphilus sp. P02-A3a]|uniref:DUF6879 family protein n=1 Tax=Streptacidiphilus sp. P02-A3a TaxID=2704468 RepID=UPI0015FC1BB7|nr:DUF6879 family protein [Streptacidiphilus sp. P02-A3a]QMU73220.1 hypothetical protein GXP74_38300 [Streptacidiphilus sp. P02-A3a]